MSGPLASIHADRVAAKSALERPHPPFSVRQHALLNLGRTIGYATVGSLLGLLGATAFASVAEVSRFGDGVRGVLGVAVGPIILAAGVGYLRLGAGGPLDRTPDVIASVFGRISGVLTARVDRLAGSPAIVSLGLVHAALPCPYGGWGKGPSSAGVVTVFTRQTGKPESERVRRKKHPPVS